MTQQVTARWTGSYPTLCFGEWIIHVDGIQLTGLGQDHFNTTGEYDTWSFDENWSEQFDQYFDGLTFDEWMQDVPNGLMESLERHGIRVTGNLMVALYRAIAGADWRHNSCGGCI